MKRSTPRPSSVDKSLATKSIQSNEAGQNMSTGRLEATEWDNANRQDQFLTHAS